MEKKMKVLKKIGTDEENKEYLRRIFAMLKRMEGLMTLPDKKKYNLTDIRLMSEIVLAECEGRRLISTQLAARLGITRSAVSQIVNKLEAQGVICRVADEVDRKIAYIELTENSRGKFEEEVKEYSDLVGQFVARFGAAKMEKLFSLIEEFEAVVQAVKMGKE